MQIHETVAAFRKALDADRASGRSIGLVPTMGYLHEGHASLMRRAAVECDAVAATIFVNPLQFGEGEDFERYPRDLQRDAAIAEESGVDHLFTPDVAEMYPGQVRTSVSVAELSEGLEGASRPGHFDGVATVVAKLFNIAGPCRAYFGEKDWQQLTVVQQMVDDLSFPVEVVPCPTVRESDGLARSSRNVYLDADHRAAAPVLYRALEAARVKALAGATDAEVVAEMELTIATEPLVKLDYAAVRGGRALLAAYAGSTRLIDNISLEPAAEAASTSATRASATPASTQTS